jgi:hypothetical protein
MPRRSGQLKPPAEVRTELRKDEIVVQDNSSSTGKNHLSNTFWDHLLSKETGALPLRSAKLDSEENALSLSRAYERAVLPRKMKRLEQQIENQSGELRELKVRLQRYRKPGKRASELRSVIHQLKGVHPELAGQPARIAALVDKSLETANKKLSEVCPKSWVKANLALPRLFSEVVKHPHFSKLALPLISKA